MTIQMEKGMFETMTVCLFVGWLFARRSQIVDVGSRLIDPTIEISDYFHQEFLETLEYVIVRGRFVSILF